MSANVYLLLALLAVVITFLIIMILRLRAAEKKLLSRFEDFTRKVAAQAHVNKKQLEDLSQIWNTPTQELPTSREDFGTRGKLAEQLYASLKAGEDSFRLPEVPEELVTACVGRECVLFGGNGLSVIAGYPSWDDALRVLLDSTAMEPAERNLIESALSRGTMTSVTEFLLSRRDRTELIAAIQGLYRRASMPSALEDLEKIPFSLVLTTHWHDLLEHTFAERSPVVMSPGKGDLNRVLQDKSFALVKINGSLTEPEGLLFTQSEYRRALEDDQLLARFLTSLAMTRSHLFLGTSLILIEDYFANLQLRDAPARSHFALVPQQEGIEIDSERLLRKYGLQLIILPGLSWRELTQFIQRLREAVEQRLTEKPPEIKTSFLNHIRLTDIGSFHNLDLDFNEAWNVILGNNGVGKSTILRALALGLCGDDVRTSAAARRLLRTSAQRGTIEIQVGQDTYKTELVRDSDTVRVICRQLTPLRLGSWVVLGFPPLRGISLRNSSGPTRGGLPRPTVGDLLPVLSGDVDERLDDLKQWIVNLEVRSTPGAGIDEKEALRTVKLRQLFFSVLNDFMPGMEVDFHEVDRRSWEVRVKTLDGIVPIEQISQGMSSLIGWLGTLLQRMFEIHADAEEPEHEPALVIIDEIDAHLHPEWQQILVPTLKKHFPSLQMIATTHSPLLVAGMKRNEVLVACRDENEPMNIEVDLPPLDFEGMRADQILTSPLFGLATTRSRGVRKDIARYSELFGKTVLTQEEEDELLALKERLRPVLAIGETPVERRVEQAVEKALDELSPATLVRQADPKIQLEIKRQLAQVLGKEPGEP